ncbi:MAG: CmcI family methyltransferase [Bacteroidota bacterium]|nr:CmcI family methyltransferase [Bacteroidota bacterium]
MIKDIFSYFFDSDKSVYRKAYNSSLRDWLIYHHREIVFDKMYWRGTKILKNPLDLWIYQELIHKIKPEIIVEIGSANGGSTKYLADLCELEGLGKVISIDISRENYRVSHQRIIEFTGDSLSSDIVEQVKKECKNKTTLVIHDADHSETSVFDNLKTYSDIVTIGSYFIVEDGIIDLFNQKESIGGHNGPLKAINRFVKENKNFEIDKACERYILTYNPKGFLLRVK